VLAETLPFESLPFESLPMVLMYHSVQAYTEDPYRVTVRPERFARQMRLLAAAGLRGVGVGRLLDAHTAGRSRGLVGLSFDDGYADFATEVLPVLSRFGFGATLFVIAGVLGGVNYWDRPGPTKRLMSPGQVRVVAAAGIEIGSHSLTHPRLPLGGVPALRREVTESRARLADLLGSPVPGFCYPYGAVGPREVDAVQDAGYRYACATGASTLDRRFAIPRTYVGDRDGGLRLLAKRVRHTVRCGASR
jgi:peptidoglycan/xylan/chitin deacetylase (PgdA/CDA1 family)